MRTPSKIITALALAGMAVVGGAAFTATGITLGTAPGIEQAFGGTVDQDVAAGVTVEYIKYTVDGTSGQTASAVEFKLSAVPATGSTVSANIKSKTSPTTGTPLTFEAGTTAPTYKAMLAGDLGVDITNLSISVSAANAGVSGG